MKLARELRLLTSRAYSAAHADVVDDIAWDAFIDTLDDVTKGKVLDTDPATLEAAQRKALLVEANMKKNATARAAAAAELAAYTPTPAHIAQTKVVTSATNEDALVERIAERVSEMMLDKKEREQPFAPPPQSTHVQRKTTFREPTTCFHCGRKGHIRSECRTRMHEMRQHGIHETCQHA